MYREFVMERDASKIIGNHGLRPFAGLVVTNIVLNTSNLST
jgi:hypothetical protein